MHYVPHTDRERADMLAAIGLARMENLFAALSFLGAGTYHHFCTATVDYLLSRGKLRASLPLRHCDVRQPQCIRQCI